MEINLDVHVDHDAADALEDAVSATDTLITDDVFLDETSQDADIAPDAETAGTLEALQQLEHTNASDLGIASVLFPAAPPPAPHTARLVRGLGFHDEVKKPSSLAGAAGLMPATWHDPEQPGGSPSEAALKAFFTRRA